MATDVILSKSMTLSYNAKVIAMCTDFTLEINKEEIDITTLTSAGWKEKKVDLKEWSVSFNGLVTRGADATYSVYDELLEDIRTNDTAIAVVMSDTGVSGTISITGNAFLTSLSTGVKVGDSVSYSGKLSGTGGLT